MHDAGSTFFIALAIAGVWLMIYGPKDLARDEETASRDGDFTRFDTLFKKYGTLRDVPWKWLKAIAWIESDLGRDPSVAKGLADPDATDSVSTDGQSYGLMQLTLPTAWRARVKGAMPQATRRDLNDPEIAIDLAAKYVRELMTYYFPNDREGVIRAYNGGPGWKKVDPANLAKTENYYRSFQAKLGLILQRQGGAELERG